MTKVSPSNCLVDKRGILRTFVERRKLPNLDDRYFAFPSQALAYALNGHISVAIFLPIGSDEEDVPINYDLAIVNLVPGDRLGKLILDTDVPGVLEGLGSWDYSFENGSGCGGTSAD